MQGLWKAYWRCHIARKNLYFDKKLNAFHEHWQNSLPILSQQKFNYYPIHFILYKIFVCDDDIHNTGIYVTGTYFPNALKTKRKKVVRKKIDKLFHFFSYVMIVNFPKLIVFRSKVFCHLQIFLVYGKLFNQQPKKVCLWIQNSQKYIKMHKK